MSAGFELGWATCTSPEVANRHKMSFSNRFRTTPFRGNVWQFQRTSTEIDHARSKDTSRRPDQF